MSKICVWGEVSKVQLLVGIARAHDDYTLQVRVDKQVQFTQYTFHLTVCF